MSLKDIIFNYIRVMKDTNPEHFVDFMVYGNVWTRMHEDIWRRLFISEVLSNDVESSPMWFDLNNLPLQFYNLSIMIKVIHARQSAIEENQLPYHMN